MSEAWLSSSEMIASCSPNSVSKTPPLASKHEEYRIVASVPRKAESLASSSACKVCVPQMKRTLAMPKPHSCRAFEAAEMTVGWLARPR